MKLLFEYDDEGYYKAPFFEHDLERLEIPEDRYTDEKPGDFIRAKRAGNSWVEGADDEYLKYLDGIRGGKEPTPIEEVKEELDKISGEKELTQNAIAELTDIMFGEINTIKIAIAELANTLQPPVPEEVEQNPDTEGGETDG